MVWFLWTVFMFSMNIVFAGLAAYNNRPLFFLAHAFGAAILFVCANEMRKEL